MADEVKLFVYMDGGTLLSTHQKREYNQISAEVAHHNQVSDEKWYMIFANEFPPKGRKLEGNGLFVPKSTIESIIDGDFPVPQGHKKIGRTVVPKTTKDFIDEGKIVLAKDEKFDEERHIVVKKTMEEKYNEGVMRYSELKPYLLAEVGAKAQEIMNEFHKDIPPSETALFMEKMKQAIEWLDLKPEKKIEYLNTMNMVKFGLIVNSIPTNNITTTEDYIAAVDAKANKIYKVANRFQHVAGKLERIRHEMETKINTELVDESYTKIRKTIDSIKWPSTTE